MELNLQNIRSWIVLKSFSCNRFHFLSHSHFDAVCSTWKGENDLIVLIHQCILLMIITILLLRKVIEIQISTMMGQWHKALVG